MKRIYIILLTIGICIAGCSGFHKSFVGPEAIGATDITDINIAINDSNMFLLTICESAFIADGNTPLGYMFEEIPLRTYCNCTNEHHTQNLDSSKVVEESYLYFDQLNQLKEGESATALYFCTYRYFYTTKDEKGFARKLKRRITSNDFLDIGAAKEVLVGSYKKQGNSIEMKFKDHEDDHYFMVKAEYDGKRVRLIKISHPKLDMFSRTPADPYIDLTKVIQFHADTGMTFYRKPATRCLIATPLSEREHEPIDTASNKLQEFIFLTTNGDEKRMEVRVAKNGSNVMKYKGQVHSIRND